jgi:hypothetical protein
MKIKITPGNAQKIHARLKHTNGRADSHYSTKVRHTVDVMG